MQNKEAREVLGGRGKESRRGGGEAERPAYLQDVDGRLLLTEQANDFIEIVALPEDDGGGFCARLRADMNKLFGEGDTVEEALLDLGGRCARYAEQAGSKEITIHLEPKAPPPPAPEKEADPPKWHYRRKPREELFALAKSIEEGKVHLAHGVEEIAQDWPEMVAALKRSNINVEMERAGIVAFYEDVAKAQIGPTGRHTYLSGDVLDEQDYIRLRFEQELARNPAARRAKTESGLAVWPKVAARAAELVARTITKAR